MDKFFQIGTITCATSTPAVPCSMDEFPGHSAKVKSSSPIFHLFLSEISSAFVREETLQMSLHFMCTFSSTFIYWTCPMSVLSSACLVLNASKPLWEETSRIWHMPLPLCFHSITEKLRLEGTSWHYLSLSWKRGPVIQGPVKPNLEYSQSRRFHRFSEEPFLMLNSSHSEYFFFLYLDGNYPVMTCPVVVHPVKTILLCTSVYLSKTTFCVLEDCDYIPHGPSLGWKTQLLQPFLLYPVLQHSNHWWLSSTRLSPIF